MESNSKRLLSRATYKRIKVMNRDELSDFIADIYGRGFEAGRKAGTPDILMRTFRETLMSIDGIGPTRADAIMKKLGDTFALKMKRDEPTEGDGTPEENDGNDEEAHGE